jgi:hypothetical protein
MPLRLYDFSPGHGMRPGVILFTRMKRIERSLQQSLEAVNRLANRLRELDAHGLS